MKGWVWGSCTLRLSVNPGGCNACCDPCGIVLQDVLALRLMYHGSEPCTAHPSLVRCACLLASLRTYCVRYFWHAAAVWHICVAYTAGAAPAPVAAAAAAAHPVLPRVHVLPWLLSLQVSAIYMWNIISYDVLGIHYFSSSNQGSYRDNTVASMITSHNAQTRGF